MKDHISRKQLALLLQEEENIEYVRKKYNPKQYQIIPAHVTLCREDEIEKLPQVLNQLKALTYKAPLKVKFGNPLRFDYDKGLMLPSIGGNSSFHALREKILLHIEPVIRKHQPHITLMHPRNSLCTDQLFELINRMEFPSLFKFTEIHLIEQVNGEAWEVIDTFKFVQN